MHYVLGLVMRDSGTEILEDEDPAKGTFTSLVERMAYGRKLILENPNIERVNIYNITQGRRILANSVLSKVV